MNLLYAYWLRLSLWFLERAIQVEKERKAHLVRSIEYDERRLDSLRLELYALEQDQPC
jgi:hypothetical protein